MTKIMVVEDDQSLREIYSIRLTAEGFDVVSAGDGEEALAIAVKEKPDLIVSDVMMPKISGFDMLDILRSTPETKDVKVIMMTALSSDDQRKRGESLGADRYLVKSQVGIEDVINTVKEVLLGRTAEAADGNGAISTQPMPQAQTATAGEQVQAQPQMTQQTQTVMPEGQTVAQAQPQMMQQSQMAQQPQMVQQTQPQPIIPEGQAVAQTQATQTIPEGQAIQQPQPVFPPQQPQQMTQAQPQLQEAQTPQQSMETQQTAQPMTQPVAAPTDQMNQVQNGTNPAQ